MARNIIWSSTANITERKRAEEELQQTLESLRKAVGTTIQVMVSAVETRDPYTAGPQMQSTDLAHAIAAGRVEVIAFYTDVELVRELRQNGFYGTQIYEGFEDMPYFEGQSPSLVVLATRSL